MCMRPHHTSDASLIVEKPLVGINESHDFDQLPLYEDLIMEVAFDEKALHYDEEALYIDEKIEEKFEFSEKDSLDEWSKDLELGGEKVNEVSKLLRNIMFYSRIFSAGCFAYVFVYILVRSIFGLNK